MLKKKNRRSLIRRIKRTTWLCIFLAMSVFTSTISFLSIHLTKQNGSFFAGMFANIIADKIASPEFLYYLGITDLTQIRPNSAEAAQVYVSLKDFEANNYKYYLVDAGEGLVVTVPAIRDICDFIDEADYEIRELGETSFTDLAQVRILINGNEVYRSDFWERTTPEIKSIMNSQTVSPSIERIINYFKTEASYYIPNSKGKPIAEVQIQLSSLFSLAFYLKLIIAVLSAALASFAASLIFTSLFTKTVTKPFVVLDKNLNYLAEGNYDELLNSHIQVKKPLAEIQSIADSTNIILDKMHEFNHLISAQNELLERQNVELETQNEELTESKRQIRDAQTQLVQNQNMASVGQLTAAISHEINTPLGTINSNVQLQNMILDILLSKPELAQDQEILSILDEMRQAGSEGATSCNQVSMIIKSLKNFSRLDQADFQESNINESAKGVVLLTRYLWKNRIVLHEEYGSIPFVKCYPGLLNQVFMNILVNAIQAIPEKGEITIKTWADKEFVYASIKDNGAGMQKEKLHSLFTQDYSQNSENNGIAMGLSICKSIMDKHKGFIEGKSELGKGTEFVFKIAIS